MSDLIIALTAAAGTYDLPAVGEPFHWRAAPTAPEMRRMGYARLVESVATFDPRVRKRGDHSDAWAPDGSAVVRTVRVVERPLSDAKKLAYQIVATAFEKASQDILLGYAVSERATWPMQQREAEAVSADANAPAPLLEAIALDGETKSAVATRVLQKAVALRNQAAPLVKLRRSYGAAIESAATVDAVMAVIDGMTW